MSLTGPAFTTHIYTQTDCGRDSKENLQGESTCPQRTTGQELQGSCETNADSRISLLFSRLYFCLLFLGRNGLRLMEW